MTAALFNEQIRDNARYVYELTDVRHDMSWQPSDYPQANQALQLAAGANPTDVYVVPYPGNFLIDISGYLMWIDEPASSQAGMEIRAQIGAGTATAIWTLGTIIQRVGDNWTRFNGFAVLSVPTVSTVTFSAYVSATTVYPGFRIGAEVTRRYYRA